MKYKMFSAEIRFPRPQGMYLFQEKKGGAESVRRRIGFTGGNENFIWQKLQKRKRKQDNKTQI